jgi:hypothetical protein
MRKPKAPKFAHFTRSMRPAKTLENIEIMLEAEGILHRWVPREALVINGEVLHSGWRMNINGRELPDWREVCLAEITSLAHKHQMVPAKITVADVMALRDRKNAKGAAND